MDRVLGQEHAARSTILLVHATGAVGARPLLALPFTVARGTTGCGGSESAVAIGASLVLIVIDVPGHATCAANQFACSV